MGEASSRRFEWLTLRTTLINLSILTVVVLGETSLDSHQVFGRVLRLIRSLAEAQGVVRRHIAAFNQKRLAMLPIDPVGCHRPTPEAVEIRRSLSGVGDLWADDVLGARSPR